MEGLADGVGTHNPEAVVSLKEEANDLGRLGNDRLFWAITDLPAADLSAPGYKFKTLGPVELSCNLNLMNRPQSCADNAGLALEFNPQTQDPVEREWDRRRIEQLLSNILSKSLQYTDALGKILVTLRETSDAIVVAIDDTSPSVGLEDREQLFEPFFRVDATRDRQAKAGSSRGAVARGINPKKRNQS